LKKMEGLCNIDNNIHGKQEKIKTIIKETKQLIEKDESIETLKKIDGSMRNAKVQQKK